MPRAARPGRGSSAGSANAEQRAIQPRYQTETAGILPAYFLHATATSRRHWRCLFCCRSIRMTGEANGSISLIETCNRAKRVACCLGSRSRGMPPATSGFDSLESRGGIFARRPVAMQEGIDHHIAHLSPACASQTRRKRHMCFGHESAATCWSSRRSRTTMTLRGARRRPGSVRSRRTLSSTRAARLPQERGPTSPRIFLFAPKVGGNKGRQCSGR